MKDLPPIAHTLGYTDDWFALGLIDDATLELQRIAWESGADHNPEHYRYAIFRQFLNNHRPLASELAAALFRLGACDADKAMGGSMMADIVRLPECSESLQDTAMETGIRHLVQIVERRGRTKR